MKNNRKIIYIAVVLLACVAIIVFVIILHSKKQPLQIVFLDVGQGDSILISQGSQQLLIDGGKDGKLLLEKLGKYVPFWDRQIETILETHPDADHIGGLIDVVQTYRVRTVLETKLQSDSQTFKKLEEVIEQNKVEKIEAQKGVTIKFADSALVEVLYPFETVEDINNKDTNAQSVVAKLTIGENKFLLTGDLPTEQENELIAKNVDIGSQFLKVAHHGSKYATSNAFLDGVRPINAIISVGKNNSYGHPNPEVLQRLIQHKINIFRTDELGDIVFECLNLNDKCRMKNF